VNETPLASFYVRLHRNSTNTIVFGADQHFFVVQDSCMAFTVTSEEVARANSAIIIADK
jgi:hypothetical protein